MGWIDNKTVLRKTGARKELTTMNTNNSTYCPVQRAKLIYSPDEGVYYWQAWDNWDDWRISQPFKTRAAAIRAKKRGTLRWFE
jgi:hypothetical protein